jgi:hypothetical protein
MYVEMVCNCEASMSIDVDQNSELLWSFATRFAAAHVKCGYIAHDRNSWESDFTKDINLIINETVIEWILENNIIIKIKVGKMP